MIYGFEKNEHPAPRHPFTRFQPRDSHVLRSNDQISVQTPQDQLANSENIVHLWMVQECSYLTLKYYTI